jgi:hypothetical protein
MGAISPVWTGIDPGRTGTYQPAAHPARRPGGTLGNGDGNYLPVVGPDFYGFCRGGLVGRRFRRRRDFRLLGKGCFIDRGCFIRRIHSGAAGLGGNYDPGLSLFHRFRHGNDGWRHRFLFYDDHLLDSTGGRNRFFSLGFVIGLLPLNKFHFGFLDVI